MNIRQQNAESIHHMFQHMFMRKQPVRKQIHKITITPMDIFNGGIIERTIKTERECDKCRGHGRDGGVSCSTCKGSGQVMFQTRNGPMTMIRNMPCTDCRGLGVVGVGSNKKCSRCLGHKKIVEDETFQIPVPKGIPNQCLMKIKSNKNKNKNEIEIMILWDMKHDNWGIWKLSGRNITTEREITLKEALIGTRLVLKHPSGNTLSINVGHKQTIQPGQIVTLDNLGVPSCNEANIQNDGNAQITFKVILPNLIHVKLKDKLGKILDALENHRNVGNDAEDNDNGNGNADE